MDNEGNTSKDLYSQGTGWFKTFLKYGEKGEKLEITMESVRKCVMTDGDGGR